MGVAATWQINWWNGGGRQHSIFLCKNTALTDCSFADFDKCVSRKKTSFNRSAPCLNSHREHSAASIRSQLAERKTFFLKGQGKSKSGCETITKSDHSSLYMAVKSDSNTEQIQRSRKQTHVCNTSDATVPDFPQTFFELSHGLSVSDSPGKTGPHSSE